MNRPTPDSSQEGNRHPSAQREFPSWEGLGVGSWSQRMRTSEMRLSMRERAGVRGKILFVIQRALVFDPARRHRPKAKSS